MIIIPGPASQKLGQKIAELLEVRVFSAESKTFPDGESYIRLKGEVEGEDAVIVQTTSPPQDTRLIQLFLMVDAARDLGAKTVTAVVPYFAYARQDKRFLAGECFSVKTIMTLLESCGVNRLITVNAHNPKVLKAFRIPVEDLSAITLLAEHFKKGSLDKAFSVSVGKKALTVAKEADNTLKGGYDYVSTSRDRVTGKVEIEKKPLPVKNRDVIVFDDIISSGGTMAKAIKAAKDQGARRVYAACVHALLSKGAEKRILKSGAEAIIGTDCIPASVSVVSVAPLIAEALSF
jgi:ribose-phosphate pyrophosphokinase